MSMKPSETEEEYFARLEYEKLKRIQEDSRKKMAAEEQTREKERHFMKCPKCGMNLVEIDYKSIKVDKCSTCEGVWLDSGELDMIACLDKGGLDKFFGVFKRTS